ncbi:hypothetical protein EIP86_009486 [Pleurotus ostreatoroseus]|nr:hypothetical protein EIP86_009486 [Pleurotus ostreatoroseus]
MLSGIGDPIELKSLGIELIVNLSDVGQHLQDHPLLSNYFLVNSNKTSDDVFRNSTIFDADLAQWEANKTGLFGNPGSSTLAFLRIPPNASIFEHEPDPSAGSQSAHFEMLFRDGFATNLFPLPVSGHFMTINTAVVSPTSRGSVRLASTDPFASPLIDPNFFNTSFDRFAMLAAIRAARAFITAAPWKGYVTSRYGNVGMANTDADIIEAARNAIVTIWHPTSTARMSPANASWGVVDPQLRVKGPIIPAAHTVAPVYIVAERAADFIKDTWR